MDAHGTGTVQLGEIVSELQQRHRAHQPAPCPESLPSHGARRAINGIRPGSPAFSTLQAVFAQMQRSNEGEEEIEVDWDGFQDRFKDAAAQVRGDK